MTTTDLAAQPIAYWAGVAHEAIITFIREQQAAHGYTQPQFWLLRNLSPHDISPDGQGMTLTSLTEAMASYLRPGDDLAAAAEPLVTRGWLRRDDDDRLWITDAGETALTDLKKNTPAIRAMIHAGIDDADYITTVKVLQQMIRNVGGAGML